MGSLDAPRASQLFTFTAMGAGYCTERVVNGLKKICKKPGKPMVCPVCPQGPNMGSVDLFRVAHPFTFSPRWQGNALRRS